MSSVASPVTRSRRGAALLAVAIAFCASGGAAFADSKATDAKPAEAKPAVTKPSTATSVDPDAEALAFAKSVQDSLIKSLATVRESSVSVFNQKLVLVDPKAADGKKDLQVQACGSGVIVAPGGKLCVVTNEHVVQGSDGVLVRTYDGATHEMKILGRVALYDIAVLEFKTKPKSWKAAKLGKSETLSEGQWVIATGNPFFLGMDGTCVATAGVISGLERFLGGEFRYSGAIQHDAEVNPGNSGGPLWNLAGELIGINGKIASRGDGSALGPTNTGASFSIPIHMVNVYLPLIAAGKKVEAGELGLDLVSSVGAKGEPNGARVVRIANKSPCKPQGKDGGILVGDVIEKISFSGRDVPILSQGDYVTALAMHPAGEKVVVTYRRADRRPGPWRGELKTPADVQ